MKKAKGLKTRFVEPYKKNENGVLKPNLPYLRYDNLPTYTGSDKDFPF